MSCIRNCSPRHLYQSFTHSTVFHKVTAGANFLAKERSYHPIYSTIHSPLSILSGVGQWVAIPILLCFGQSTQAKKHLLRGGSAILTGCAEAVPVALAILSAYEFTGLQEN